MKNKSIARIGKRFGGAVVAGSFLYSIVVLTAIPAYAVNCTPDRCAAISQGADILCERNGFGHVVSVTCPIPGHPDEAEIDCETNSIIGHCV